MGNICRSPTAEGVFRHVVQREGMTDRIHIDSAGTHAYHIGEPPDARSQAAAAKRGYDVSAQRARQVAGEDFAEFDYVLAMDAHNRELLLQRCPPRHRGKVRLFLEFAEGATVREVPDPYYGGAQGFEEVLDLVEHAAEGLLRHIKNDQ